MSYPPPEKEPKNPFGTYIFLAFLTLVVWMILACFATNGRLWTMEVQKTPPVSHSRK